MLSQYVRDEEASTLIMISRASTLGLLLLLAGCAAGPQEPVAGPRSLTVMGYDALAFGDLPRAETLLTRAVAENPEDAYAHAYLGEVYEKTDRHPQARREYLTALGLRPETGAAELERQVRTGLARLDRAEASPKPSTPAVPTEPVPPAPVMPVAKRAAPFPAWVQVGFFSTRARAERHAGEFGQRFSGILEDKVIRFLESGDGVRVQLGPYADLAEARRACEAMRRSGAECFAGRSGP